MTSDEIVDAVLAQGGFPSSQRALAYGWLNEVHKRAVAESQWLMQQVTIGLTVAGSAVYGRPEVMEPLVDIVGIYLYDGTATGKPSNWQKVSTTDMWDIKAGRKSVSGGGGVFAPYYGAEGDKRIELFPVPATSDMSIVALAAALPLTLVPGLTPAIPGDMHGDLLDGAIALGLLRMDERADSAANFNAKFESMVLKLTRRKNSRVGSRTARMQLHGTDWR